MMIYSLKTTSYKLQAAFTLIEMLVVISIFLIMTGVILANFPAFRDKAALDLLAQEIATTIRQAQVYGIGTREAGSGSNFTSYGIYFDLRNVSQGNTFGIDNRSFYLYADRNFDPGPPPTNKGFTPTGPTVPNCTTSGSDDCFIEKFAITGAAEIYDLKGCNSTTDCSSLNLPSSPKLDIFFQRFYPEATLPSGYSYVKIMIQSTRDASRKKEIQVWTTGQIVVANG